MGCHIKGTPFFVLVVETRFIASVSIPIFTKFPYREPGLDSSVFAFGDFKDQSPIQTAITKRLVPAFRREPKSVRAEGLDTVTAKCQFISKRPERKNGSIVLSRSLNHAVESLLEMAYQPPALMEATKVSPF